MNTSTRTQHEHKHRYATRRQVHVRNMNTSAHTQHEHTPNYLSNRKQRVVLNRSYSDYSSIESGVPQGSVLGPLLFLVYISDLERNIKCNIRLFSDDTMLFPTVKNPELSGNDFNHDFDVIRHFFFFMDFFSRI